MTATDGSAATPATPTTPTELEAAPRSRRLGPVGVTVLALLVLVLIGAGFLGWTVIGTDVVGSRQAGESIVQTRQQWSRLPAGSAEARTGEVIGIIAIPAISVEYPIVAGVEPEQLEAGVGWYSSTAWPGEVGNAAFAGLRLTHGSPFRRLLDLTSGDSIVIETADATSTYRVVVAPADLTVEATDDWVLDAIPGHADVPPDQAILTLTTAQDLVATSERSVAFATLVSRQER